MHIDIRRGISTKAGTFGLLYIDGLPLSISLERETPVIPAGDYVLARYNSPEHGEIFLFTKPSDHAFADHYFEIHPLNVCLQSDGCIGLGKYIDDFDLSKLTHKGAVIGEGMMRGIAESADTIAQLMKLAANEQQISITIS